MPDVTELFGSMVFNDAVMKSRMPKNIYKELKSCIAENRALTLDIANVVANAMKDWAVEKGATHYTHWFQPMTGITAEKHDSFISPTDGGGVIMEFSGKELIKGEPDASSFPSGGLRATFEARGYTAWDPSSYAFIKEGVLCIPTAFCSYSGEALDKKTPLLRSMEAINLQVMRILRLFKTKAGSVSTTVGPEQEYFLVDKSVFDKRRDLIYCGRTLFGAKPPKGQELEDHYFGALKPRVAAFMTELDCELWRLGIQAKTEHNEAAPGQHELAPIYTTTNIATDHNQLTMELMKKVALRHGMVCLLHEKPFAGVNGSGKHNNWSLCTDRGENLLEPGETPSQNARFLLFLAAVMKAVDEHQDLLRMSVASAGNDHRLGGNEAPPAIVSMFIGDELASILDSIESGDSYADIIQAEMEIGAHVLPKIPKDSTDRNRTSPFAFTGNKFEFRMLGSSASISGPNVVLNTIVADALMALADELESSQDFTADLMQVIRRTIVAHKRIVFNGNNYSEEWALEAQRRGLMNMKTSASAMPCYCAPKNVELFSRHKVLTPSEVASRCELKLEGYCKALDIEALTMVEMAKRDILPAAIEYCAALSRGLADRRAALGEVSLKPEGAIISHISGLNSCLYDRIESLEGVMLRLHDQITTVEKRAQAYTSELIPAMQQLRTVADELETAVAKKYWPYPTYGDILFSV